MSMPPRFSERKDQVERFLLQAGLSETAYLASIENY